MALALVKQFHSTGDANPQVVPLTPKSTARDLLVMFVVAATATRPTDWVDVSTAYAEGSGQFNLYFWRLPANKNTTGVTSLTIALNGARALSAVVWEDDYDAADPAITEIVGNIPTADTPALWGTGLHTLATHDELLAVFVGQEGGDLTSFDVASYDQSFTELADTGLSAGTSRNRIWIAHKSSASITSDGVTATMTIARPGTGLAGAAGMIAYSQGAPLPPDPVLGRSPATLQFDYEIGADPPADQSISVTNDGGGGTVNWTATVDQDWVTITTSGTAPSTLNVSVDPSGFGVGDQTATVTITSTGVSGSPQTTDITLTVTPQTLDSAGYDVVKRWRSLEGAWRRIVELPDDCTMPELHGARGDLKTITDAAITINTANLDSASGPFKSSDVGKWVSVRGAGLVIQGGSMMAQIESVTSATRVVLDRDAAATVSGAIAHYGTDDAQAWTQAIAALVSDGLEKGNNSGRLLPRAVGYMIAGSPVKGGSTKGNSQIQIPVIPSGGPKFQLSIDVPGADGSGFQHWRQPYHHSGCTLFSPILGQTIDGTWGVVSLLGGPTNLPAEPDATSPFSNMLVYMNGITFVVPRNPSLVGVDLGRTGQFNYGSLGFVADGSGGPTGTLATPPTNDQGMALRMPAFQNNDNTNGFSLGVLGWFYGVQGADHFNAFRIATIYCDTAFITSPGGGREHGGQISYMSVEGCNNGFQSIGGAGSIYPLEIARCDIEVSGSGKTVIDPNNSFYGNLHYAHNTGAKPTRTGGKNWRIIDEGQVRGPVTAPSVPSSNTVLENPFWRDAWVHVSGGTVSQIQIDGTTHPATTGPVFVPTGSTIRLTYSSAPTWFWTLA